MKKAELQRLIKEKRKQLNLTQPELAEKAGVGCDLFVSWSKGKLRYAWTK